MSTLQEAAPEVARRSARQSLSHVVRSSIAVLAACGSLVAANAQATDKPIQLLVGFTAGGIVDTMARAVADQMGKALSAPVVVINREGASGSIALMQLLVAPPDGQTLSNTGSSSITTLPHENPHIKYNPGSFEYVCQTVRIEYILAVPSNSRFKTIQDLIAALKAEPGSLTYGHGGKFAAPHLAVESIFFPEKLHAVDVPYKGEAPIVPALVGGMVDFGVISVMNAVKLQDRVRPLLIVSDSRSDLLPHVPTSIEAGFTAAPIQGLTGIVAPKGTPAVKLARLTDACKAAVGSPAVLSAAKLHGVRIAFQDAQAFERSVTEDYRRSGEIVRRLATGTNNVTR